MEKKIYISPSDQDYNAYAVGNTNEAVQCRKIAVALVDALERCGFQAKAGLEDGMSLRVSQSNEWGADLHLCIHTNAFDGKVKGTRLFCYSKNGEDYRACAAVMAALAPITPGESDSITVHHFYEVLNAKAPTVYLEVAFHDNKEEAAWIIDHIEEIAEAICQGVCNHYGVAYTDAKPQPEAEPEKDQTDIWYRVQVGAFRNKSYAEALLKKLHEAGFTDAYIRN
jgi:N-acetylmuramoyl-L-alanine amidase